MHIGTRDELDLIARDGKVLVFEKRLVHFDEMEIAEKINKSSDKLLEKIS